MTPAHDALDDALKELGRLKKALGASDTPQVRADDPRRAAKATALTWFHTHRETVAAVIGAECLTPTDKIYQDLIAYAAKATLRSRYTALIKAGRKNLVALQTQFALELFRPPVVSAATNQEVAPAFDPVVSDPRMRAILKRRWDECVATIDAGAPLAATVMMGGLLEALLLARVNSLTDKSVVLNSAAAPKSPTTGKVLDIRDWMLKSYIDVAHEMAWISPSAKDVGVVLRDYRNYIHPQKEYSHGIVVTTEDAKVLWGVAKSIIRQLLATSI